MFWTKSEEKWVIPTPVDFDTPECNRVGEAINRAKEYGISILCKYTRGTRVWDAMAFNEKHESGELCFASDPVRAVREAIWTLIETPREPGDTRRQTRYIYSFEKPPLRVLCVFIALGLAEANDYTYPPFWKLI